MNRCPPRDNFRKIWAFVGTNKTDTLCAGVRINWVRWQGLHCKEFLWEIKLTLNKWTKMGKSYKKCKDIVPRRLSLSLYEVSGWFTPRSTFKPASLLLQISRSKCTQFLGYVHNRKLTRIYPMNLLSSQLRKTSFFVSLSSSKPIKPLA